MTLRLQGIHGKNLPSVKSLQVTASDFSIGGMIGFAERRYKQAWLCQSIQDYQDIFGENASSSYYAGDAVKGFWDNVTGSNASMYFVSHVGYTGSAYDGVAATSSPIDGSAAPTIRIDAAYKTVLDYSTSGNRTGYQIVNGARFSTTLNGAANTINLYIVVNSVSGIKVGDLIKCTHTGPVYVYKKVTSIDETNKKVYFVDAFGSAAFVDTDLVEVMGFQLKVYRTSLAGLTTEVQTDLGQIWCTMESEVTDFYVNNVMAQSKWIKATDLASASVLNLSFPANVSTTTFLTAGVNGTVPTTAAMWALDLPLFDGLPIRFLANPETTTTLVQQAIEIYCRSRWDNPLPVYNVAANQSKAQLITIGQSYQRSDDVLGVIVANWLGVADPFTTAPNAADRQVPNVGHVMGMWIRSIVSQGIHWLFSNQNNPMYGVNSVVGSQFLNDQDRTDLCNAGINVIQQVPGQGTQVMSAFTPSTDIVYMWANKELMRNYFKVSFVDSLKGTLNEPNSFARIKESKTAMLNFYYTNWFYGSTGNVPEGETFGQGIKADGTLYKPEECFYVQADLVNNPQSSIALGYRNLDSWFSSPAGATSIYVGVGALLLS